MPDRSFTVRFAGLIPVKFAAILALSVLSSSCLFHKSPAVFTPPPLPAPNSKPRNVEAKIPPLPEPPQIDNTTASIFPELPNSVPEAPAPPTPKPPARRGPVAATPPQPTVPATTPEPVPLPRLSQIFTADQARELNRTLDETLDRVRRNLAILSRKNLSAAQVETANRITAFQKQAEQARAQDLLRAVDFAKRADLLAVDLVEHLPN